MRAEDGNGRERLHFRVNFILNLREWPRSAAVKISEDKNLKHSMKTRHLAYALLITGAASLLTGCVERRVVYVPQPAPAYTPAPTPPTGNPPVATEPAPTPTPDANVVTAPMAPPAVQTEVVPVAPGPEYYWVPGYWGWSGRAYVWVGGRWAPRPWHGAVWIGGHWGRRGHGYVWVGGHWR
jgi:hypothetical protein